jgi:hypothetical protein
MDELEILKKEICNLVLHNEIKISVEHKRLDDNWALINSFSKKLLNIKDEESSEYCNISHNIECYTKFHRDIFERLVLLRQNLIVLKTRFSWVLKSCDYVSYIPKEEEINMGDN